jgi:signal transduction histidine kinase
VAVADRNGKIVGDSGLNLIGKTIPPGPRPPGGRIVTEVGHVGDLLVNPEQIIRSLDRGFLASINKMALFSAVVAGLAAILITLALSRRVVQPVTALTAAAQRMGRGDLSARVKVASDDEIGELARSFNSMADGLARQEKLRRNMVSDIAHELRTPLTNLRGYVEAARDGLLQPDRQWLESLYEEAVLLHRLVDDLQQLTLAEARELRLERAAVKISDLTQAALDSVRMAAEERGLTMLIDTPADLPAVYADAARIGQVLRNLLNNALDFTPQGGEVVVAARADGQWVNVEVRDNGRGIAPEHLPLVFERFYRVDASRARSTGGSGLGLTIVKNLVEAHGGRVWVSSTPNVGSTFGFSLPVASAPEPAGVSNTA